MTPELEQHLRETYPLIFSGRCELSVGDGWFDILDILCGSIQGRIDNVLQQREWAISWNAEVNDPDYDWEANRKWSKREEREVPDIPEQVVATQIKEKFGTLRFYYSGHGDDYIRGLESMAESMTSRTCEDCGHPGKRHSTEKKRWVRVLCDKHAVEHGYLEEDSD